MASAGMIAKLKETFCQPRIKFLYDGVDYSYLVLNVSEIRRDWNLSPCTVTIELNNIYGTWDTFLSDDEALTKKIQIQFYLADFDEEIDLYAGYVEKAVCNYKRKTMTITARDRLSRLLENQVQYTLGGQIMPIALNYLLDGSQKINPHIVSDIVWELLTTYAKLSSTESAANTDISYTSWMTWAEYVDNGGYDLYDVGITSNGASVRSVLLKLMQMIESMAWGGGDGKVNFKASTQTTSGQTYTKAYLLGEPSYEVTLEGRCNSIQSKFAYDYYTDYWQSNVSGIVSHSHIVGPTSTPYLYQVEYEGDQAVFHNTEVSCQKYIDEKFLRTAPPIRNWAFQTNLLGFIEDVGNEVILSGFYVADPYDSIEVHLTSVAFDVMNWIPTLSGYYIWGVGEL